MPNAGCLVWAYLLCALALVQTVKASADQPPDEFQTHFQAGLI